MKVIYVARIVVTIINYNTVKAITARNTNDNMPWTGWKSKGDCSIVKSVWFEITKVYSLTWILPIPGTSHANWTSRIVIFHARRCYIQHKSQTSHIVWMCATIIVDYIARWSWGLLIWRFLAWACLVIVLWASWSEAGRKCSYHGRIQWVQGFPLSLQR